MAKLAGETKIVRDEQLGIDRKVVAGDVVPNELAEAYEKAGGGSSDRPVTPGGQTIASKTVIVHDDALGIDRKVVEGTIVPPDLVDPYYQATGEKKPKTEAQAAAGSSEPTNVVGEESAAGSRSRSRSK